MDLLEEIRKIRRRCDEIEADLPTNELEKAVQEVLNVDKLVRVKHRHPNSIVFAFSSGTWHGSVEVFKSCTKPLFRGEFYIQPQALSAIEHLDKVFGKIGDC